MNRIDRIISESINRFILREIDEGIDDTFNKFTARINVNGVWKTVSASTKAGLKREIVKAQGKEPEKRAYNKTPKVDLVNLTSVCNAFPGKSSAKARAIAKVIRNEWYSRGLGTIRTFNNNGYLLGVEDSENLHNRLSARNNNQDPFVPITNDYTKLLGFTDEIEKWGSKGDYNSVHSRLCDMPLYLDDLADALVKWFNETGKEVKTKDNSSRKGGVINGYKRKDGTQAINGLIQVRRKPKEFGEIVNKLRNCANTIRYYFGDNFGDGKKDNGPIELGNDNELGITTKPRR